MQIIVVLFSTFIFALILEGFGYTLLRLLSPVFRRLDGSKDNPPVTNIVIRIFLGGLFYTLIFLLIGLVGLMISGFVLGVSLIVPTLAFVFGRRWQELSHKKLSTIYQENKFIIWGSVVFGVLTFIFWFRPIANFDSVWYHLTIPKLFLQNHDVRNQGGLLLYSLQPSMDYFWNLWPLSLPVSTAVASIVISSMHALFVCLSVGFATSIGKKIWGWNKANQFLAPILIGFTFETVSLFGIGGNDLIGLAFGVVATLYCLYLFNKPKITWSQFIISLLLIVGLATIKIFFTVYASLVLVYLLVEAWPKLPTTKESNKKLFKLAGILLVTFFVAYLPWLIRAFVATGRPLDPLGIPELTNQFYIDQGGGTAVSHWTDFIFKRFYASIGPMLFFIYSPLVLAGVLSIFNKNIRAKAANLWLVSCLGFLVVFFASITLAWRYYMPQATLLVFLGIAVLIDISKSFDLFKYLAVGTLLAVLVATIGLRVIYTTAATAGAQVTDATIEKIIYVRHFTNVNDYLSKKITTDYGYIQQQSPEGLTATEKIFIGNTYEPIPILQQPISDYDVRNIHNLAYVKNPIFESTMDPEVFEDIKDISEFKALLKAQQIRYIVSRKSMAELCQHVGVQDSTSCETETNFKKVLADDTWHVNWYMMVGN